MPAAAKPASTRRVRSERRRGAVASIVTAAGRARMRLHQTESTAGGPPLNVRVAGLPRPRAGHRVADVTLEPTFSGDDLLATVGPHVDMLEELRDTFAEQYPEVLAALRARRRRAARPGCWPTRRT